MQFFSKNVVIVQLLYLPYTIKIKAGAIMRSYLIDANKCKSGTTLQTVRKNTNTGILLSTSYYKNISDLMTDISIYANTNTLTCLKVDCLRKSIFDTDIHLPIFEACNQYQDNPQRTKNALKEKASLIARTLIRNGIDIYISPILSLGNNIFNSVNANDNFREHHITIISTWINALNSSGMLCCIEPSYDIFTNQTATDAFNRLQIQFSAIAVNAEYAQKFNKFNGDILEIISNTDALTKSNVNLKKNLGSSITQEYSCSIEI